jgi:hypothetical protein
MSYETALNAEIDKELDRLGGLKETWRPTFVTQAICAPHLRGLKKGKDRDFWLHCGYEKTRAAVARRINKRAADVIEEDIDAQPLLPGYNHLHTYYLVRRGGDDIAVPVENLTDDEIDGKIARIEKMGQTCFSHASEFRRFKRERAATRKGAAA